MNKRIMSLALALMMVLGTFTTVFAADTSVLPEEMNAEWAGAFLKENKILTGDDEGDLKLEENLLRKDSVFILARLLNKEAELKATEADAEAFTDLTENPVYNQAITWAKEAELVEGNDDGSFGGEDQLTAGQYSTILVRALGYDAKGPEAWSVIMDVAKKHDLFNGMKEVEKDHQLTRGEMAVMTFNALGATMNGTDETLAEHLGIKIPAKAITEAKVKDVRTENYAEVIVEFEGASTLKAEKLADANNYRIAGKVIEKAIVDGDIVTLVLKDAYKNEALKEELVIRNIDREVNGKYTFKVRDNVAPSVEKVEVLGEYGIKVTMSEPIKDAQERDFLIDGKNVAMVVDVYGRDIILSPYHRASFNESASKLTVRSLTDHAGFKSVEKDFDIKIEKDEVAPKVVSVVSKGNDVIVTFDKDIYKKSVEKSVVTYESGRHTVKSGKGEKIGTNVAIFNFDRGLPRRVDVTVEGIENHSEVAMEKEVLPVEFIVDYSEPTIIDSKVVDLGDEGVSIVLTFDKDLNVESNAKVEDHFTLYKKEVKKDNEVSLRRAEIRTKDLDKYQVALDLGETKFERNVDYVLEVDRFEDTNRPANRMYREYVEFKLEKAGAELEIINIETDYRKEEIEIKFNKPVDRRIAEDGTNYVFTMANGTKKDLEQLGGRVIVERNGKTVSLVVPKLDKTFEELAISRIRDIDGNRMKNEVNYTVGSRYEALDERIEKVEAEKASVEKDIKYALEEDSLNLTASQKAELEKAKEELGKIKLEDNKSTEKEIEDADKKVKDAKKLVDKIVKDEKAKLDELIKESEELLEEKLGKDDFNKLAAALANANIVSKDKKATLEEVVDAKNELAEVKKEIETK